MADENPIAEVPVMEIPAKDKSAALQAELEANHTKTLRDLLRVKIVIEAAEKAKTEGHAAKERFEKTLRDIEDKLSKLHAAKL